MNSQKRVLTIFMRLLNGEKLSKKDLMADYGKDGNTIQRDIRVIQDLLDENTYSDIDYGHLNRKEKGQYQLKGFLESNTLQDIEIFSILKVLLNSRALQASEMDNITRKLLNLTANKKSLQQQLSNERLHYQEIPADPILPTIQFISNAICKNQMIEFEYSKLGETRTYRRSPQAIQFTDIYFHMYTASHASQDDADLSALNKFRVNAMRKLKIISDANKVPYSQRFEGGVLRKQTVLPFLGNPITMVVDFYWDPIYVLDRFPDSKIIGKNADGSVRLEVPANDGYGVKMWLLSQGDMIKVISPKHIKDYIIQDMVGALKYYGINTTEIIE